MATYDLLRDLPVEIDSYSLEGLVLDVSSGFTRHTTVIKLAGGGEEGVGEDVTYDGDDQLRHQEAGAFLPLAGSYTVGSFSDLIGGLDTFPQPPDRDVYRIYRRWGFESAALDLALRQAGIPLTEALGREAKPLNFVVSMRLGEEPTSAPVRGILENYPDMKFKLDATSEWTDELIEELRELGAVDSIDLKGQYKGTVVDQAPDVDLYRRVIDAFPDAWIEDPDVTPETKPVLERVRDRVTWDAIIHSVADIEALEWPPKTVNVKPSRFGSLQRAAATPTTTARSIGSARTAAGSSSSGPAAGRSSTSPPSSIPTRRTTSRRAGSTSRVPDRACRRARWRRRSSRPGSAGETDG